MPRTQLTTITRVTEAGVDLAGVDGAVEATDGNSFAWGPNRGLWVLNGEVGAVTVTIPTPGTVGKTGLAISDQQISIPAGAHRLIGPFGRQFVQTTGLVHVDYTGAGASTTAAVIDCLPN